MGHINRTVVLHIVMCVHQERISHIAGERIAWTAHTALRLLRVPLTANLETAMQAHTRVMEVVITALPERTQGTVLLAAVRARQDHTVAVANRAATRVLLGSINLTAVKRTVTLALLAKRLLAAHRVVTS